jgi:general secretion pathway protein I
MRNRFFAKRRGGFSLLEVILAMAILTGGIAVLGEVARLAIDCARSSRQTAQAQLICQSKMEEIISGSAAPTAVDWTDPGVASLNPTEPKWLYAVTVESSPSPCPNLLLVSVCVHPNLPAEARLTEVAMSRWMIDPNYTNKLKQDLIAAQADAQAKEQAYEAQSASTSTSASAMTTTSSAG